jgi:SAM-dependent methyltransferase
VDGPSYIFDNAATQAGQRFASLETLFDPISFGNLDGTGVGAGWRCMEVGAGGGSVAGWLAHRVGPEGHVLATDLDPHWVAPNDLPGVEVRRHDIARDPLPEAEFDLIHARLVLIHVPQRMAVLPNLVAALRPGGWLVIEDFDLQLIPRCTEGRDADEALMNQVWEAIIELLVSHGGDPGYGHQLTWLLDEAGLTDVHVKGDLTVSRGGTPGAVLQQANVTQTRDQLIATGLVTRKEIERFCALLDEPHTTLMQPLLFAARGRRP